MIRTPQQLRSVVWAAVAAALVAGAPSAHADFKMWQNFNTGWQYTGNRVDCNHAQGFTHWNTRDISYYHNTGGGGAGKDAALKAAMKSWTDVPNAAHVLTYEGTTTAGWVQDNRNTLVWGPIPVPCSGCIALVAVVLQSGQVIVEADTIFSLGPSHDVESVAAHELGHTLGIHHPNTLGGPQTMSTPYWGTGMRSLHADDMAALQCSENRYPPPPCLTTGTPKRPLNFYVQPWGWGAGCFGYHYLDWDVTCGNVTRYEMYGSLSPNFTNQWLEYSGPHRTQYIVNVSQTTYYRIRACNSSTCSTYRLGNIPAHYYPGCSI